MQYRPGNKSLAALVLGGTLLGLLGSLGAKPVDPAPELPAVTVARPEVRELVEWHEFTGRFEAVEHVEIRARVSGYLDSVHFREGQLVHKDDLLFVIDPRPYEAAVARAEAEVARAESRAKLTDLEVQRAERLLKGKVIPVEEADTRRAANQGAHAEVAAARAALRSARLDLGYTRITAPVDGRISSRNVDAGNLVAAGAAGPALTSIVSIDPLHFVFDVSESEYLEYARARFGDGGPGSGAALAVNLRLLDEHEWPHTGYLDFMDNQIDQRTGTLRFRAVFDNPDGLLRPGVFGRLRLPATAPERALLIPDAAVLADQSSKIVLTLDKDDTVKPQPVELGPLHDGLRIVRHGLTADDRVIVEGLLRARPGSRVAPQVRKALPAHAVAAAAP